METRKIKKMIKELDNSFLGELLEELIYQVEVLEETVEDLEKQVEKLSENPPLKFEEIGHGDRIWDIKNKYHLNIHHTTYNAHTDERLLHVDMDYCTHPIPFEEGRYFEKEVK